MLKMSEIKELVKLVDQTSIDELEWENEGSRLCIRKHKQPEALVPAVQAVAVPQVQPATAPNQPAETAPAEERAGTASDSNLHQIVSPMVGTFYRAPSPGAASFVNPGDRVHEKSVVCIVEAMKLMNEIEAEVSGEIVEVLAENGQLVEYGQPLFLVKTE